MDYLNRNHFIFLHINLLILFTRMNKLLLKRACPLIVSESYTNTIVLLHMAGRSVKIDVGMMAVMEVWVVVGVAYCLRFDPDSVLDLIRLLGHSVWPEVMRHQTRVSAVVKPFGRTLRGVTRLRVADDVIKLRTDFVHVICSILSSFVWKSSKSVRDIYREVRKRIRDDLDRLDFGKSDAVGIRLQHGLIILVLTQHQLPGL